MSCLQCVLILIITKMQHFVQKMANKLKAKGTKAIILYVLQETKANEQGQDCLSLARD